MTSATSFTISPAPLVRLTRGKLACFLYDGLNPLGLLDTFTCALPQTLPFTLLLDVQQIANASHELVMLLQTWKCPLVWGCRVDGPGKPEIEERFLPALTQILTEDIWWPTHHYLVSGWLPDVVFVRLQNAGVPCTLQSTGPDAFVQALVKTWNEPPQLQPERILPEAGQVVPLAWLPDNQRLVHMRKRWLAPVHPRWGRPGDEEWRDELYCATRQKRKGEPLISLSWLASHGIKEASYELSGCAWSPDCRRLALSFSNDTVILQVRSHHPLLIIPFAEYISTELAWSPDG